MTHHLINRRLVVPVPQLWLVLAVLLVASTGKIHLERRASKPRLLLMLMLGCTSVYGLISLQLYISGAILLPWLLPSLAIGSYLTSSKRNNHA